MQDQREGISAFLSTVPEALLRPDRKSSRIPVQSVGAIRKPGGSSVKVQILDLSTHGFRVETHLHLSIGASVWVRLPGLESKPAKVVWQRQAQHGCAFDEPLHTAVLAMIVQQAR